jgi:hypothetical protein
MIQGAALFRREMQRFIITDFAQKISKNIAAASFSFAGGCPNRGLAEYMLARKLGHSRRSFAERLFKQFICLPWSARVFKRR